MNIIRIRIKHFVIPSGFIAVEAVLRVIIVSRRVVVALLIIRCIIRIAVLGGIVVCEVFNITIQGISKPIWIIYACVDPSQDITIVSDLVTVRGLSSQVLRLVNVFTRNISAYSTTCVSIRVKNVIGVCRFITI